MWRKPKKSICYKSRVADPHHFNAVPYPAFTFNTDSDSSFHFNADVDPDPATQQSEVNLRPLFYRPPVLCFEPPRRQGERLRLSMAP